MNSSTNVATAMISPAHGSRSMIDAFVSTSCAAEPPTSRSNGASTARISFTSFSPAGDTASTDGTTLNHVPLSASKRADDAFAGRDELPVDEAAARPRRHVRRRRTSTPSVANSRDRVGVARVRDDDREGFVLVAGELGAQHVRHLAAVGARGQHAVVGQAEHDAEERQAEHDEERDDRRSRR